MKTKKSSSIYNHIDCSPLMQKQILMIGLILLTIFTIHANAVCFANDTFTLYENEEKITDGSILIFTNVSQTLSFEEIYNGEFFEKSQSAITNLTFYKLNQTTVLDYPTWSETKNNATYTQYTQEYIQDLLNESIYQVTIEIPDAEDTTVYNQPLFGVGGMIGSYRYFTIDLTNATIELTETKIPESPGFNLLFVLVGIGIMIVLVKRKRN